MDTNNMIQTLQDPLGVPFYPMVFQGLSILTFALHIFFVNLVLGGALIAAWGYFSSDQRWQKLSRMLAKMTTINISIAIVLGVAPLLFVQVIYDPFWYTSNLLSAWWTMLFLAALITGALAMYVFYLKRKTGKQRAGVFGLLAVACILFAALIIHVLSMQALHPEQWLGWYVSGLKMNTAGWGLNSLQISRLLHFLVPALLNTGIFLMLYAWYFKPREDLDQAYLAWAAKLGLSLARYAVIATALIGIWWLIGLPAEFHFMTEHSLIAGYVLAILLIALLFKAQQDPSGYAPSAAVLSLVTLLVMSVSREALRLSYLKPFGYSIYDYPTTVDWGSTSLFLATFVLGIAVVAYLLRIAFKAGRGEYMQELKASTEP